MSTLTNSKGRPRYLQEKKLQNNITGEYQRTNINPKLQSNLLNVMKSLNTESYKTLMQKVKEDVNKGKGIARSWVGRLIFYTALINL
jgi:hypothetical protein